MNENRTREEEESEGFGIDEEGGSSQKNSVKNIIKAFEKNLKEKSTLDCALSKHLKNLRTLIRRNKFNNQLVVKIICR